MTGPSWFTPTIVVIDGVYHLQVAPDRLLPVFQHDQPMRSLASGWHFQRLNLTFAPILVFELRHESGERAIWFFNAVPHFIGNSIATLPVSDRVIFLRKATDLVEALLAQVIGRGWTHGVDDPAAPGEEGADPIAFFHLPEPLRRECGAACRGTVLPSPHIMLVAEMPEALILTAGDTRRPPAVIRREHVAASLADDFQVRLLDGLKSGALTWRSPVDGEFRPVSGSFEFNDFDQSYRLEDPNSGLVCFALVTQHVASLAGLYFPTENLVIVAHAERHEMVVQRFPDLPAVLIDHVCRFGATLLPYLRRGKKRLAAFQRESHIGHYLWNELSGLDIAVQQVDAAQLPDIFALGGHKNFYGPLDAIFPELVGRTGPDLPTFEQMILHVHQHDMIMARVNAMFVSKNLRDRILSHVHATTPPTQASAVDAARDGPIIVLGLRVENRTAVDLPGVMSRLVAHIARLAPGCCIVLDGQNTRADDPDAPIGSFAHELATRSPVEAELDLCRHIADAVRDQPVQIVKTSGQSIASSLRWTDAAACFIALWGAGLAKYRWINNKPGLILCSHFHLTNPAEMSIYDSAHHMEGPTPLRYVDPACVRDDPNAVQLVPFPGQRWVNFHVDEDAFLPQVTQFLAPFLPRSRPTGAEGTS